MLVVETVVRIRREHANGKAIKAIAWDLRLSRKVVRKAIRAPEGVFDYHRTVQPLPRLGPFQGRLDTLLTENETRHRRDRLRMTRIHDLLQREGSRAPTMRSGARPGAGRKRGARMRVTVPRPSSRCCSNPARPTSLTGATRTWRSPASRCG